MIQTKIYKNSGDLVEKIVNFKLFFFAYAKKYVTKQRQEAQEEVNDLYTDRLVYFLLLRPFIRSSRVAILLQLHNIMIFNKHGHSLSLFCVVVIQFIASIHDHHILYMFYFSLYKPNQRLIPNCKKYWVRIIKKQNYV